MSYDLRPGTVFAGYRILRILGKGGMGTVYLARHPRMARDDALKILSPDLSSDPEYSARFHREAELAARLDHPNVVAVWDRGMEEGRLWIAMQYVDGMDAETLVEAHPSGVPVDTALDILGAAAQGLDAAHRAGLLHRDVKPANILLERRDGRPGRVYVSDFGIAKAANESAMLTAPGMVMATLAYAAPEQIEADILDQRTDVYALGCTFYELLTGSPPFPRGSNAEVMTAHLLAPVPTATARRADLPAELDAVIARALAKDPALRYPSCGALARGAREACYPGEPVVGEEDWSTFASGGLPPGASVPGRGSRRWSARVVLLWIMGLAAAVAATGVGLRAVAAQQDSPPQSAVTSATTPAASGTPITWGSYDYMAQAFPALLPSGPFTVGYQGLRCATVDANLDALVPADPPPALTHLWCRGDSNPVRQILVLCNSDRGPSTLVRDDEVTAEGSGDWQHGSERGRMFWANGQLSGTQSGILQVGFEDPARNFCQLYVSGGSTGQQLVDWWASAPI
ncbi:serine/threonine-protein kinase [Nocardia huaxiensis]|uniref:serine/threonine-protein kinase n=1 Tax=Nocardia huaxiensis TaxID=2755382 RepID=UPI001E2AA0DD|nr:serine/threonine-protein kinase [Nocardia huaxiensis]UFS98750.1 serine/threonine protein kinase [Nocardia huaxiensis]